MPSPFQLKLAVIEGRWFRDRNISVKPLFDVMSDITVGTPHGFHYETFASGDAFQEIVRRLGEQRGIRYLYVAAHGSPDGLISTSGEEISLVRIRHAFREARLDGVFFGSCSIGREGLANALFAESPRLAWVAGYEEEPDWIESSVMDLAFWYALSQQLGEGRSAAVVARAVRARMAELFPIHCVETGFDVFLRGDGSPMTELCLGAARQFVSDHQPAEEE